MLSKTQLDFSQLHHSIFLKAIFPPKCQWCLDVLAQSATCLQIQSQIIQETFN